jgi:hypothetical protein
LCSGASEANTKTNSSNHPLFVPDFATGVVLPPPGMFQKEGEGTLFVLFIIKVVRMASSITQE